MRIASLVVAIAADVSALRRGFSSAITQTRSFATRMQAAFATFGVALGVRQVIQYADAWTLAEGRLRLYTASAADLVRVQSALFDIAQQNRQEFNDTATLYTRLVQSSKALSLSSNDVLRITKAVGQALRLSNAGVQESASTMRQLSQAFSSARFQGDELRSVIENAPVLAAAIAESLGITIGQLRELGAEGKVAASDVAKAILEASAALEKQSAGLPTTIGQAFTQLGNSIQKFIGETSKATGASRGLVRVINSVGEAFDKNRPLVEALVITLGVAGLAGAVVKLTTALAGLAFTQAIQGLIGLGTFLGPIPPLMISIRLAATAMWAAITGPIGLAIIGLSALFLILLKFRRDAAKAAEATEALRKELSGLSAVDLRLRTDTALAELVRLRVERNKLQEAFDRELGGRSGMASQGTMGALAGVNQQIKETQTLLNVLIETLNAVNATTVTPPGGGGGKFDFEAFTKHGGRLLELFDDLRDRKQSVVSLTGDLVRLFDTAEAKLSGLKDPLSDEASALRTLVADIRGNVEAMAAIRFEKARLGLPFLAEPVEQFADRSQRLLALFQALSVAGLPARSVAIDVVAAFSQAETAVAGLGDRLDDDAVALRRVFSELRAVAGEALRIALAPAEAKRITFTPTIDTSPAAITAMVLELQATGRTTFRINFTPTLDSSPTAISGMVQNLMSATTPAQRTLEFQTVLQPPSGADLRNFQAQVEQLVQAKGLLDLAILTGDKAFQQSTAAEFDRLQQKAIATLGNLAEAVKQTNIPFAAQRLLLLQIAAIAAKIPAPFKEAASSSAKFITAGRGLAQIAQGFTNINREVLTMVSSILDAVGAIEQFNAAKKAKDTLGQISGALGVVGAAVSFGAAVSEFMFGAIRRAQKELADTLRKNGEELASLNVTLKGFRGTFGDQAALLTALTAAIPAARRSLTARPTFDLFGRADFTPVREAQADFIAAIARTGFSVTELAGIARDFGITLLDSTGRIIPQAVGQFVERLELARLAAFRFENALDDVTLATRLRNAAAGIEGTPERILTDTLLDFKKLAPAIFEQFFASINFADGLSASELTDIRRQSQALVEAFLTEALNPDLLLGFKSPEEFAQFMLTWIESLNQMTAATDAVTRSLVNVPEGFKIDRARFQATIADASNAIKAGFDQFDPAKTGKLQGATMAARQTVTVTNNFEIEIAGSSKSGAQLFSEISVEAKRLVKAKSPSLPASAAFDL